MQLSGPSPVERHRASTVRLIAAAYAERRAIERDLHDGIQQELVALAVNLQLARQLVETDLPGTLTLLDELNRDVHRALEGVQKLGQRVYPPLLASRGLAEALRAARSGRVEAERLRRYPPDLEAMAYFCCLEALEHAVGDAVVRIRDADGRAQFEVVAEGGFGDLTQLRERLELLGCELSVTGTRVAGTLPIYDESSAR
jgi:signal transduction histidine kinase